ncbi:glycosyltransferase [Klebsiella pneumoniae]
MNKKVVVVHPGLQHSHQLALALHEHGMLQKFISGVPVISSDDKPPFFIPKKLASRIKKIEINANFRQHPIWIQALLKVISYLPVTDKKIIGDDASSHRVFHWFDFYASKKIKELKPDVVVAFENSAYHTFKVAKSIGAKCVLDAPSLHHSIANKLLGVQSVGFRKEIDRRKDMEVELADVILTCSPIAAQSYLDAGGPEQKVRSMLLGAELPKNLSAIWQPHEKALRFIFAGALSERKSVSYILNACERLNQDKLPFSMSFVGGASPEYVSRIESIENCAYIGKLSQPELYQMIANSDCLLLPSKFDSFGMVVAEAMACGTPAIVSNMTGSKAIIEHFPGSGWIIEPTEESIYSNMKYCIENTGRDRERFITNIKS